MNSKTTRIIAAPALVMMLAGVPAMAEGEDIASAVKGGKASIDLRYRYEFVDQDGFSKNANASTLRFRLNYQTGEWQDWSGFVEFDQVLEAFVDNYNSGAGTSGPGRDVYPVVADPDGSDLNQMYLQYAPGEDWLARLGRQRILLDDQRFVGGVGWRQNEQTYDAVSFDYDGFGNGKVFYSYVSNVNRIFGDEVPAGNHGQDTHLLNGNFAVSNDWKVTGYAYLIDNEDSPGASTDTFGVRVSGGIKSGDNKFDLLGEYAIQSDAANNPASFDADYFRLQGIWNAGQFSAGAGYEVLGSDNGVGFSTPLATLHAFNGWADQFLATPGDGLEDLYIRFGMKPGKWDILAVYHDFSADASGTDYGSEIDLSAGYKLTDRYSLLLKAAMYSAGDPSGPVDTTKFWLMLTGGY
ncbi:MAG: alginate export family protein [Gammaproteobacteria bacterium]|nr:alginate export family protein [Gammaproteobacteria bacterium]